MEPRGRRQTLDAFLDSRSPGFDLVRLVLAACVLVSHSWTLGGFGLEPGSPLGPKWLTLGGFAVGSFFALSGLLVGRSAMRRGGWSFASARAARIGPALFCAIAGSAFVAGALGYVHQHGSISGFLTFSPEGPFAYVARAITLPIDFSHSVYDVFAHDTPYGRLINGSSVNGSLWTLPYEVRCYLVIGVVAATARRWRARTAVLLAWMVSGSFVVGLQWWPKFTDFVISPYVDHQLATFAFVFLSGAVVGLFADRIAVLGWVPAAAIVLAVLAGHRSVFWAETIAAASMSIVLPAAAALVAPLGRFLHGADLSYGLYLYAWPVQMVTAMYGWADGGPWAFVLVSGAITVALAAVSWFAVERPVLERVRRSRPRTTPPVPVR